MTSAYYVRTSLDNTVYMVPLTNINRFNYPPEEEISEEEETGEKEPQEDAQGTMETGAE